MGITRLTAMIIKTNKDIRCTAVKHESGKWSGWISLWKEGTPHICPMLESQPQYDNEFAALVAMEKTVKSIRELPDDLNVKTETVEADNGPQKVSSPEGTS